MDLTFRSITTENENEEVEFLDVLHQTQRQEKKRFITKNYIKPTAEKSTFINGKSFHPKHIYKGIIYGESNRMRRLNEREQDYQTSLKELQKKCNKSEFDKKITKSTIQLTSKWKKIKGNEKEKDNMSQPDEMKKKKVTWATRFKSLITLNPTEKKISKNTQITYARPNTIGSLLTNYRKITQIQKDKQRGQSQKCGRCGLCGNHGKLKDMVWETKKIKTKEGKHLALKHSLKCTDYGIYGAKCRKCGDFYVGQTVNKFSVRWNGHRQAWENMINKKVKLDPNNLKDEQACTCTADENIKKWRTA